MTRISYTPSEKIIKKIEQIISLHENGLSYEKIARKLGLHVTYIYALKRWYFRKFKK